jgi:cytochrome c oxidase subunit II
MGIRRSAAFAATAILGLAAFGSALADPGQPVPGGIDLQAGVTPLRHSAIAFHNYVLMPVITVICLFVLALLVWCAVRFNKRANPTPAKWAHNTPIEIIWTVAPVLILMVISIFSFRLLFAYHDMPKPDVTVKATGYQWYWGYEYPDQKVPEFISSILPEDKAKAAGKPFRLAATEPMVVPVGKTVRVLVTGADVIHAYAVPAFGIIADAIPGRVNETWFNAERIGVYYGNCRELCGVDHAFMPIEVHVVSQADFDAWVASKAGGAPAPTPTTLDAAGDAASTAAPAAATAPSAAIPPGSPSINPAAQGGEAAPAPVGVGPTPKN